MKKAGIITFHNADNFGAVLQCYALQEFLAQTGYDSYVIDHADKAIIDYYKVLNLKGNIKEKIVGLLQVPANFTRKIKFNKFRKRHLKTTKTYRDCDLFVCGSDQIWNFNITNGYNPVYFADFEKKDSAVTVSYAASIGAESIPEYQKNIFKNNLEKFSKISVREDKAKEIINDFLDCDIPVLPDPTLLIDKTDWSALATNNCINKDYLLIYSLNNCEQTYKIANVIAKKLGLDIIEIRGTARPYKYKKDYAIFDDIGPSEFLSYIKNSTFVVTDSFHGTVFSVIFEKNFYSIPPNGLGSRMETLLTKLDLMSRLVNDSTKIDISQNIDYKNTANKLKELRNTAIDFFKK